MGWASTTSFLFLFTVCIISLARTDGRTPWVNWLVITVEEQIDLLLQILPQEKGHFKHLKMLQKANNTSAKKHIIRNTFVMICHKSLPIQSLPHGIPVLLLTCSQAVLFRGRLFSGRRGGGVDEGMTDGADNYAILLHFSPQAVEEGLRRMLRRCIWQADINTRIFILVHKHKGGVTWLWRNLIPYIAENILCLIVFCVDTRSLFVCDTIQSEQMPVWNLSVSISFLI